MSEEAVSELAQWFAWFADQEAAGRSPRYAEFAAGAAGDRELLGSLCQLPPPKRQPNLVMAAVRHVCGLPDSWLDFRNCYFDHREEITAVILERRTQTNEPARCATLLPLLAQLPQPLALLEVGAAAGLCLLPDRYGYDYGTRVISPVDGPATAPVFACRANQRTPLPAAPPTVVWRAGLDLNPIDVTDPEQVEWLETLVWPGEGRRLELLRAALDVARRDPPTVIRGDLRRDLPALADQAPRDATLVVFHTAVLAYLDNLDQRAAFGERVAATGARWISNEGDGAASAGQWPSGQFVLSLDGRPVALTDSHGTWIEWL